MSVVVVYICNMYLYDKHNKANILKLQSYYFYPNVVFIYLTLQCNTSIHIMLVWHLQSDRNSLANLVVY